MKDSIYSIIEGVEGKYVGRSDCTNIYHRFFFNDYRKVEYSILTLLTKCGFINRKNIERFLDVYLGKDKWSDYSTVFDTLKRDGAINVYEYGDLTLYCASDTAKKDIIKLYKTPCFNVSDKTSDILESASMSQFFISLKADDDRLKAFSFNTDEKDIYAYLKCHIRIKKLNIYLHAYPFPKSKESLEKTVKTLKGMPDKLKMKYWLYNMVLIVCGSTKEMYTFNEIVKKENLLPNKQIYYALDSNTASFAGLTGLYTFDDALGNNPLRSVSIM